MSMCQADQSNQTYYGGFLINIAENYENHILIAAELNIYKHLVGNITPVNLRVGKTYCIFFSGLFDEDNILFNTGRNFKSEEINNIYYFFTDDEECVNREESDENHVTFKPLAGTSEYLLGAMIKLTVPDIWPKTIYLHTYNLNKNSKIRNVDRLKINIID